MASSSSPANGLLSLEQARIRLAVRLVQGGRMTAEEGARLALLPQREFEGILAGFGVNAPTPPPSPARNSREVSRW